MNERTTKTLCVVTLACVVALVITMLIAAGDTALDTTTVEAPRSDWVVTLVPGSDPGAVAAEHGARLERALPALSAAVVSGDPPALSALRADSRVESVSANVCFEVAESGCCEPWDESVDPHAVFTQAASRLDHAFGPLRARTLGEGDVLIAVLDTGFDASHTDLRGAFAGGRSFVEGASWDEDRHGHGTAMASLIAARPRPTGADGHLGGLQGVAPGLSLLPVRVADGHGRATLADVAAGIVYAVDRGAEVILLSLGARQPARALDDAVRYAEERGVLLVAAAGNRNVNQDLVPAADPRVLSVGAVDDDGKLSHNTTLSPTTDVLAPGVQATAAIPRGGYGTVSGTSVAAARMAAAAGLVRSLRPELSPRELRALLKGGTRPLPLLANAPDASRVLSAGVFDAGRLMQLLDEAPRALSSDPRVLPARVVRGERIRCSVRVTNPYPAQSPATALIVDVPGAEPIRLPVPALAAGEAREVHGWATARASGLVRFVLDDDTLQAPVTLAAAAARDLALAHVQAETTPTGDLTLTARVEGRGSPEGGALEAVVGGRRVGVRAFPTLGVGEIAEVVFDVPASTLAALPELFVAQIGFADREADDAPVNDRATLDLERPGAEPRASMQYQQNGAVNLICDAPFRLEPQRPYLPLLVFEGEKGSLDTSVWVRIDRATVKVRDTAAGTGGTVIYDDRNGGPTTHPLGLVVTDELGQPVLDASGAPDPRLFKHDKLDMPGRYTILRLPRSAFALPTPQTDVEPRFLDVVLEWTYRRTVVFGLTSITSESNRWVLKVDFAAQPRPRFPGASAYYDAHVHTIAEWYHTDALELLAPRRNLCGPIPMLKEAAYAIGITDAVDAVKGRVILTDHNATLNPGDSLKERPPFGPSSVTSSNGLGEFEQYRQLFGVSAGEEITINGGNAPRSTGIAGITLSISGGTHMLSYRAEHWNGPYHGGSDLFRLLGDPSPDVKLEDILQTFAKTNRAANSQAVTFAAHPYGDNDWNADSFQTAFEIDPATRVDLPVHIENTGFVSKGVQLWNADNKRHRIDSSVIDWSNINPWAEPSFLRTRDDWDKKLNEALTKYHEEQLEPLLVYELAARPGVRFPRKVLTVAGNDAHGDFNYQTSRKATIVSSQNSFDISHRAFGRVATYVISEGLSGPTPAERDFEAMTDGNSILTDGPIADFTLDAEGRFDGATSAWHDTVSTWSDADGKIGGGGDFDGRGTALVPRGSTNTRFGYRWASTPEFGGDVESIAIYRTSVGDPNPTGAKPSGSHYFLPRGWLAPGAAAAHSDEAVDPSEEGTIQATSALQLAAFTDADPSTMNGDERRCYSNPIWAVPFDASAAVGRVETDANGNGSIPPGELVVTFEFDMSLRPDAYRVEIKALNTNGDSSSRNSFGPIDVLGPLSAGGAINGWSAFNGAESARYQVTNTAAIPVNLDRYPAPDRVTFVVYFLDPPRDPFGNALNPVAFTFDEQGVGTGGGTGPSLAIGPAPGPGGVAPVPSTTAPGTTAPGSTATSTGGGGGGGGGCALGGAYSPAHGTPGLLLILMSLVALARPTRP